MKLAMLAIGCIWTGVTVAATAPESDSDSVPELWLRLLHYKTGMTSAWQSDALSETFFLTENGRVDPQGELDAHVQAFSDPKRSPTLQCRFPARFEWIKENYFGIWPQAQCTDLQEWYGRLNPEGITLVFSAAYANNPASMFGHTFLRIDQQNRDQQARQDLLSQGVAFLADVDPRDNTLLWAAKGIFGGYDGRFQMEPYYQTVAIYSNRESRDLWEYALDLTNQQLRRVLLHLWEVINESSFTYTFSRKNCSWQLLALLEVADPRWQLTEKTAAIVLPLDTVRILQELPIAHGSATARASLRKRSEAVISQLPRVKKQKFGQLLTGRRDVSMVDDPEVLQATAQILHYRKFAAAGNLSADDKQLYGATLKQMAALDRRTPEVQVQASKIGTRPDKGHRSSGFAMGAGNDRGDFVQELHWRTGLHDFLDPAAGYDSFAAINYFSGTLQRNQETAKVSLNQLSLIEILSINPWTRWFPGWSWSTGATLDSDRNKNCPECLDLKSWVQFGAATAIGRSQFWALTGPEIHTYRQGEKPVRLGMGWELGATSQAIGKSRLLGKWHYTHRVLVDREPAVLDHWLQGGISFWHEFDQAVQLQFRRQFDLELATKNSVVISTLFRF